MQMDWTIWQLVDSAFPCGGFAHSGGLEAAAQWGEVDGGDELVEFIRATLTQTGAVCVPFVVAAHRRPGDLQRFDRLCNAHLSNHVANRASRKQGQAFLASAVAAFSMNELTKLHAMLKSRGLAGHLPPVFGAVTSIVRIEMEPAVRMFLFITLRSLVSSAVRLNLVGPLRGQAIQHSLKECAEQIAEKSRRRGLDQVAQTAPFIDLLQGTHDRLYCRLFQS